MSKKFFEVAEHVTTVFRIEAEDLKTAKQLFLAGGPTDGKRKVLITSADYVWQNDGDE